MSRIVFLLEERLVPEFQKVSGARRMATKLSREGNTSHSFRMLLETIHQLSTTLKASDNTGKN